MVFDKYKPLIVEQHYFYAWSWKLVSRPLFKLLSEYYNVYSIDNKSNLPAHIVVPFQGDFTVRGYIIQTVSLFRYLDDIKKLNKAIVRLGGNKSIFGKEAIMNRVDLMKICHGVIATNEMLYDFAKQLNPNTVLIPNGLDLNEWKYVGPYTDEFVVGFAANVSDSFYRDYKGYDFVLTATKKLNIPLKQALFGNKQIPHNKMRSEFYSKISCLIMPTRGEGCSNVIMEALACGIPVLTTRTAGYHGEKLTDMKNVIFIERNTEDIMEKLELLRNNPELMHKLSINGRRFAENHHNIKIIAKKYKKEIDYLLRNT